MNQSQIHLALTHLPVILTLTGSVVFAVSVVIKNAIVTKVSFYILLTAGLFVLPVFFSGEGAEEAVKHLPGVSESVIKEHENFANFSIYVVLAVGLLALAGLLKIAGRPLLKSAKYFVMFAALFASGLMIWTAHLGGKIRHTEISLVTVQAGENQKEDDD
jgi:hypothetical protein